MELPAVPQMSYRTLQGMISGQKPEISHGKPEGGMIKSLATSAVLKYCTILHKTVKCGHIIGHDSGRATF